MTLVFARHETNQPADEVFAPLDSECIHDGRMPLPSASSCVEAIIRSTLRGLPTLLARSINSYDVLTFADELPATDIYFSVFGSTYRRRAMPGLSGDDCNRNRICVTGPALQHFHEVRLCFAIETERQGSVQFFKLIDHRVVKYLDGVAAIEHESIHRIDTFKARVRYEETFE